MVKPELMNLFLLQQIAQEQLMLILPLPFAPLSALCAERGANHQNKFDIFIMTIIDI